MKRLGWWVVVLNLLAIAALSFAYPQWMIAPGALIDGHHSLEGDCFACHRAWRSVSSEQCVRCHQVDRIGLFTVAGAAKSGAGALKKAGFHQQLTGQDCLACHGDHRGIMKFRPAQQRFSHDLLRPTVREACAQCHRAPSDSLHRRLGGASCAQCHRSEAWKPAEFEHDRYFVLDRRHDVKCETCHRGNDFGSYTCYGCHEHSPARVAREHEEEGIGNLDDCARCHRSANEHDIRGGEGRERGEKHHEGRRRHDDDDD